MGFDMLEVEKDRLNEIDKQIKKAIRSENWNMKKYLEADRKKVIARINHIEEIRHGR